MINLAIEGCEYQNINAEIPSPKDHTNFPLLEVQSTYMNPFLGSYSIQILINNIYK